MEYLTEENIQDMQNCENLNCHECSIYPRREKLYLLCRDYIATQMKNERERYNALINSIKGGDVSRTIE